MHKNKWNLLFDPCAFPSSRCARTLIRSLKLKRPKDGRCDQTPDTHLCTSHQLLCYYVLHSSACFPSSLLHHATWFALWLFLSRLSAYEGFWTPLGTLLKFFSNSLLIWLIISWMKSNCPIDPLWTASILTPAAAEYKWLAVRRAALSAVQPGLSTI